MGLLGQSIEQLDFGGVSQVSQLVSDGPSDSEKNCTTLVCPVQCVHRSLFNVMLKLLSYDPHFCLLHDKFGPFGHL